MSRYNFIYASDLPHRAKAVYVYLRDRSNTDGVCWPEVKTIARELKLSPRTVQRALNDLERAELVERPARTRENGGRSSNLYRLRQDRLRQGLGLP